MIALRHVRSGIMLINSCTLSTTSNFLAGHSHWQNVRHVKAAKDKEKSDKSMYFTQLLRRAVKEKQPGSRIKDIIASARAAKVPQATLDRALNDTEEVDPYVTAARATGGVIIVVESVFSKPVTERQKIASVVKKYGFKVEREVRHGFWSYEMEEIVLKMDLIFSS